MRRPFQIALSAFALTFFTAEEALASGTMNGTYWEVNYGSCGTWNDASAGEGYYILDPHTASPAYGWNDVSYAANPWQQLTMEYDIGGTAYFVEANSGDGVCDLTVDDEDYDATWAWHQMSDGNLEIMKYEQLLVWGYSYDSSTGIIYEHYNGIRIWFEIWNTGATDVDDFRLMWGVNPDLDYDSYGYSSTANDNADYDGDGVTDWAGSWGASCGIGMGISPCEPSVASIGFSNFDSDADGSWTDPNGTDADRTMHYTYEVGTIAAGEAASFGFVVGGGSSYGHAQYVAVESAAGTITGDDFCGECDDDGDEFTAESCGGNDCDDEDSAINPAETEVWYDGTDDDCDGNDCDFDGDGEDYDGSPCGGDDCDDTDASVSPDATEVWYDGVDQDCDGDDCD